MRELLLRAAPGGAACAAALFVSGAIVHGQAAGQDGLDSVAARAASIQGQSTGLQVHGDGLVGFGPDYKVYLREGGFDFVPALGAAAPRSQRLSFELESVHRGTALVHAAERTARPARAGLRAEYARGSGIAERYDVLQNGVEQSFVFDAIPSGAGDLVVRGKLSTGLALAGFDGVGGLRFEEEQVGGVRYGGVTGVDGAGRTVQGTLALDGDRIELSLPSSFLDTAVPPLVLDPLIGSVIHVAPTVTYDEYDVDVAYDATNFRYLVVWERAYSSTDFDIRGQLITSAGTLTGSGLGIETSVATLARSPSVGNCNVNDRFLVAYTYRPSSSASYGIAAACVSAATGSTSGDVVLVPYTTGAGEPDVGGEATLVDDDVIVVYRGPSSTSGIRAQQVTVPATGDPFLVGSAVTISSGDEDSAPAISKSGGETGRLLVVWTRFYTTPAPGDGDIVGRLIDRNGVLLTTETYLWGDVGPHEIAPDCDGDGTDFVAVWERNPSSTFYDGDIYALRLTYSGGALISQTIAQGVGVDSFDEYDPAVGYTGEAYVVSHTWAGSSPNWLQVTSIDPQSCETCETTQNLGVALVSSRLCEIATQNSGGVGSGDGALIVWAGADTLGDIDIEASRYRTDAGEVVDLGGGCGQGGEAKATCAIYANADFTHRVQSPSAFLPAYLIVGLERIDMPCGSCTIVPNPFTGYVLYAGATDYAGRASFAMPIPNDPDVVGFTFIDQWVLVDASPACTALGVDLSNAIQVTIE